MTRTERVMRKNGIKHCIRDRKGRVVANPVGYTKKQLASILARNPGWYHSTIQHV